MTALQGTGQNSDERRYRILIEHILDSVAVVDISGATIWTSAGARGDLGYEKTFWEGANLFSLVHPDDLGMIESLLEQVLAQPDNPVLGEVRLQRPDGAYSYTGFSAVNRMEDPDIGGIVITARNIELEVRARLAQADREQELQTAANQQSDFIAGLSHEMRSPLHTILGLSELLSTAADIPEDSRHHIDAINRESEVLRRMIDQLLDFSKISAGRMELVCEGFSPANVADYAGQGLRELAAKKGLAFSVHVDPAVPLAVLGDEFRLRQILVNLLSNATKYTTDGSVSLHVEQAEGDLVRFEVRDTGPGIPDDAIATLFEPYAQARTTDSSKGTGLGLAIAKHLVELMGGTLGLTTSPAGTTFTCEIPFQHARRKTDFARAAEPTAVGRGRVLVVDDSAVNLTLAVSQLERIGYDAVTVNSGVDALEILAKETFDVVLMDWHMPGLDGLETTRRYRRSETAEKELPIIAMTASAMSGDRERCLAAGMSDYLSKPVSKDDLATMVGRWISPTDIAAIPEIPEAGVPDTTRVENLVEELGDVQLVISVIQTFLAELPQWRATFEDSLDKTDYDGARRAVHTLKSTAALLGALQLSTTCASIEQMFRDDPDAAAARGEEFNKSADGAERELTDMLQQLDVSTASDIPTSQETSQ